MPTLISPTVIDTTQQFSFSNVAANVVSVNTGIVANGTLGTSGQVLTSNGSASYWAPAAGGGVANFVAASSIAAGNVVVLNSNGTVSTVGNVNDFSVATSNGGLVATTVSATDVWPGSNQMKMVWLSSNTYVVVYTTNAGPRVPTARAFTVSGATVTPGTAVSLGAAGSVNSHKVFKINDTTFGCIFRSGTGVSMIAGSVSGTTITLGAAVVVDSSTNAWTFEEVFDPNSSSYVVVYLNAAASTIKWASYTISGTTWTSRNSGNLYTATTADVVMDGGMGAVFHQGINKIAVASVWSNNALGSMILAPASANSTNYVFETYSSTAGNTVSQPIFMGYERASNTVLLLSNRNGSTFGAFVYRQNFTFNSGNNTHTMTANTTNVVAINTDGAGLLTYRADFITLGSRYYAFSYANNTNVQVAKINVDLSNNIVVGTPVTVATTTITNNPSTGIAFNENTLGMVVGFANSTNSNTVVVQPGTIGSLTSTFGNWIGISTQAASDSQTVPVTIMGGVNDKQAGLTPGSVYYVQSNGALTTSVSSYKVGKALSANNILITVGNA